MLRGDRSKSARNGVKDGGAPRSRLAGAGSKPPQVALVRKTRVVSVKEKSRQKTVAGEDQGDEHKRTIDEASKH